MSGKRILWMMGALLLGTILLQNTEWTETESAWSLPLSGVIIALDPGHGGVDGGAKSKNGLKEKDIALSISLYLRDFLQQAGALVIMTRETDQDLAERSTRGLSKRKTQDLKRRVELVNESNADTLVSIHLNAIASSRWHGAQTFYFPARKKSGEMAYFIQDEIKRTLENTTRFPQKNSSIYLLKSVNIPAVLVEVGFLSNSEEAAKLSSEKYQIKMANAIYQGILRFYSGEKVPENEVGSRMIY